MRTTVIISEQYSAYCDREGNADEGSVLIGAIEQAQTVVHLEIRNRSAELCQGVPVRTFATLVTTLYVRFYRAFK